MSGRDVLKQGIQKLARFEPIHQQAAAFGTVAHVMRRRQLFTSLRIDLVLDVGANVGQYGRELRSNYSGQIISFEPVSNVYQELRRGIGNDRGWSAHNMALGRENTTLEINVSSSTVFSSFLKSSEFSQRTFGQSAMPTKKERVAVKRLEELLPELVPDYRNRRIFLKMDTQGFDLEVFMGLGELKRYVHALQSEVSVIPIYDGMPHWTEGVSEYERHGFAIAGLFPVNMDGNRVIEFDCLMVNASA
ncbi:FkbM family methyltransferase [Accumulibacter sp.]|uniref:FkbM family methyltransferase n=1 Tax=Accumulibacter sp. TaxID=2053492 RepID=UPI0025E627B5|nr:FkbM family methyltransferase [Accumulibacter sp.]MCM8610670.1 FkbM family methyltransferase [Accumulibacter sp.]MCM8634564.1 FkbM family methyltransferase [Accumulibacter sp.]MCM8641900.1 FkbM family methyltransferase [Accumulibacter sp.]